METKILEILEFLQNAGSIDWSACDSEGTTAMFHACGKKHTDTVKYWVEKCNADLSFGTSDGRTPLFLAACSKGSVRITDYALSRIKDGSGGWVDIDSLEHAGGTLFHAACEGENPLLVKLLVDKYHANPHTRNHVGVTPLHVAARVGCVEVVKYLVNVCKSGLFAQDICGIIPLHLACKCGHYTTASLLLDGSHET